MEHHRDDAGKEPLRQPQSGPSSSQPLNHRISNISDLDDFEPSLYGGRESPPLRTRESVVSIDHSPNRAIDPLASVDSRPARARDSLVSIDSRHTLEDLGEGQDAGHSYPNAPTWRASSSAYSSSARYAPVAAPSGMPSRTLSRGSRRSSYGASPRQGMHDSIQEEDEAYDLSLLGSAAPMASDSRYAAIAEEEYDMALLGAAAPTTYDHRWAAEENASPHVDVSAMLGPMTTHDAEFIKLLQAQEAQGNLTGGLGRGFQPDSTVSDADLLRSPTTVQRNLSRSFTRRRPSRMGRAETIRHAGQDEANRRGQVIEVVPEQPAEADLSNMEGPSSLARGPVGQTTFPNKLAKTQVFYPQPNWRPFSMRWVYLTFLITISLGLAAMQEILFQKYKKNPLLKFKSPEDVKPELYFAVKFAPTLSAVVFGVLWQFTDFEVRRLEAYYQLSKQDGALASASINVDYVTSFSFFRPIRAIKLGQYAVALSSVATTLAISLVPTFAAASVILSPGRDARQKDPDGYKTLNFSGTWSRLLSATLVVCAVAGAGLLYTLQSRRSGLLGDVRGIAGLASMAVVSHILMDFKDMDTAKHKDIHQKLKRHRYMLRNSSLAPHDNTDPSMPETYPDQETHLSENPHPQMLRPAGTIPFIIGLLLFMGFIPVFLFTPADIVTEKAPWVITALAVSLKLAWHGMETAVRMMEPYYILSRRHAPSKTLTLDYTALPFGYLPLRALFNGHILMFLVGFGSVMAEFLTIMVTGLATVDGQDFLVDYRKNGVSHIINSGQETVKSFYLSFGLSVFTLLYMSVVATIVFLRRRHPFLPRQPNTIASVLAFIHQSKMLYDFVGTAKLSNAEMVKRLETGKTYGLGWFEGRDGQTHCGVDHEELLSNYKHGINFLEGNQPWNTTWDVL